jgi:hypothetical protein
MSQRPPRTTGRRTGPGLAPGEGPAPVPLCQGHGQPPPSGLPRPGPARPHLARPVGHSAAVHQSRRRLQGRTPVSGGRPAGLTPARNGATGRGAGTRPGTTPPGCGADREPGQPGPQRLRTGREAPGRAWRPTAQSGCTRSEAVQNDQVRLVEARRTSTSESAVPRRGRLPVDEAAPTHASQPRAGSPNARSRTGRRKRGSWSGRKLTRARPEGCSATVHRRCAGRPRLRVRHLELGIQPDPTLHPAGGVNRSVRGGPSPLGRGGDPGPMPAPYRASAGPRPRCPGSRPGAPHPPRRLASSPLRAHCGASSSTRPRFPAVLSPTRMTVQGHAPLPDQALHLGRPRLPPSVTTTTRSIPASSADAEGRGQLAFNAIRRHFVQGRHRPRRPRRTPGSGRASRRRHYAWRASSHRVRAVRAGSAAC